jgi:hypothetical protein
MTQSLYTNTTPSIAELANANVAEAEAEADADAAEEAVSGPLNFYELVLRDDRRLDRWIVDPELYDRGIRKFLGVSVAGTAVYGTMVGLVAQVTSVDAGTRAWLGTLPMLTFPLALTLAFLGALMVCLPSFYFYTQLSSLDASFRIVTGQALRAQARTAALLLGVLPIYVAIALGAAVGVLDGGPAILGMGICLPFIVGIAGLTSLARSFHRLSQELPVAHVRRPHFLSRLVLAWGAVYSVVAPVALYRLLEAFGRAF